MRKSSVILCAVLGMAVACTQENNNSKTKDESEIPINPIMPVPLPIDIDPFEPENPDVGPAIPYDEGTCDDVPSEISSLATTGFDIPNVTLDFYGCESSNALECMAEHADADDITNNIADANALALPGMKIKLLKEDIGGQSRYWLRSSADGRFVGTGNGIIHEMKSPDEDSREIKVVGATIDAVFSPDNSFYGFPGMICKQSPLSNPLTTEVGPSIEGTECTSNSLNDYASIGYNAEGEMLVIRRYSATNYGGVWDGSDDSTINPDQTKVIEARLTKQGVLAEDQEPLAWNFTGESDYQLSPSGKILVGRMQRSDGNQAFRVRMLRPNGVDIDPGSSPVATICAKGGKPGISFDNRYIAFHHYQDTTDGQDEGLEETNMSNIFIYDLLTKKLVRVTNMPDGTGAFFPHFRADGWLIFQIKDDNEGIEKIVATNAALLMK